MTNPLLVGIDGHRKTNTVCLMDAAGQEIEQRFNVANNRLGTQAIATEKDR